MRRWASGSAILLAAAVLAAVGHPAVAVADPPAASRTVTLDSGRTYELRLPEPGAGTVPWSSPCTG